MRTDFFHKAIRRRICPAGIVLFLLLSAASGFGAPQPQEALPLHMSQDRAVYNPQKSLLELFGNVVVTQGTTTIRADHIKVFLKEGKNISDEQPPGDDAVDRLLAVGNVSVTFESGVAYASEAEYRSATQQVVFSGPGTKFVRGKSSITGARIIYDRGNETVTVESAGASSVTADIFPKDQPR